MKVVVFHPALAPYRIDFFNLLAERVDLDVALLMDNLMNQKFDQGVLKSQCRFHRRMLTSGFQIKGRLFRFGIRKLIREIMPDVVLSYEASPITLLLCFLRKFARWHLWTSMDEAAVTIKSRKGFRAVIRDFVLRNCDGVIAPSEEAASALREICPKAKTAVVPIIHDTVAIRRNSEDVISRGKMWRRTLPVEWTKVLLFVGRLAPVKNLPWLVDQMEKLSDNIGLVIVGDGEQRELLKRKVQELRLQNRVLMLGKKEGDELYSIMSAADALVLPSTFEPYGAVVAEAMQWGTPALVSDKVGAKELLTDVNGAIFKDNFGEQLQKVMSLRNGTDSILKVDLSKCMDDFVGLLR